MYEAGVSQQRNGVGLLRKTFRRRRRVTWLRRHVFLFFREKRSIDRIGAWLVFGTRSGSSSLEEALAFGHVLLS